MPNQKVETRKSRRTRHETLDSPNDRISAYMHSEKLNEQRELDKKVQRKRAVRDDRSRPETKDAGSPKSRAGNELLPKLARVQRADVEAEAEDEVAAETEEDKPSKLADRRNLTRVDKADEVDRNLLSKYYLPESIDEFLPNVIPGPDDNFVPPAWLMQAIEEVASTEVQTP